MLIDLSKSILNIVVTNFDVTNFNEDISKINVATSENLSSKEQLNNVYENYNRSF